MEVKCGQAPLGMSHARSPVCPFRDDAQAPGNATALCPFRMTPLLSPATEHQNYFGIDENLGPVAVSIRREKVEDAREREGSQFNYRVAFRTSEVRGHRAQRRSRAFDGASGCSRYDVSYYDI